MEILYYLQANKNIWTPAGHTWWPGSRERGMWDVLANAFNGSKETFFFFLNKGFVMGTLLQWIYKGSAMQAVTAT